jgi:hypothetical protein
MSDRSLSPPNMNARCSFSFNVSQRQQPGLLYSTNLLLSNCSLLLCSLNNISSSELPLTTLYPGFLVAKNLPPKALEKDLHEDNDSVKTGYSFPCEFNRTSLTLNSCVLASPKPGADVLKLQETLSKATCCLIQDLDNRNPIPVLRYIFDSL